MLKLRVSGKVYRKMIRETLIEVRELRIGEEQERFKERKGEGGLEFGEVYDRANRYE